MILSALAPCPGGLARLPHVRPSKTEPIVRVIAEAPRAGAAAGLCQEVGAMLG